MDPHMTPTELTAVLDEKSSSAMLAAVAAEVKKLQPGVDGERLAGDLADRSLCHTTLRGPLLIMETQCPGLDPERRE